MRRKHLRRNELGLTVADVPPFAPTCARQTAVRRQLWRTIVTALRCAGKRPQRRRRVRRGPPLRFSDVRILEVYFFAVLNRLPIREACDARNWPICLRGKPLPDPATMSRRMRSRPVLALLDDLDRELVRAPAEGPLRLVSFMDGMPLRISPHSTDPHAKFGHAGGVKAKGYKLHVLLRADGLIVDWRLTPLGGPEGCEKRMARRMLRSPGLAGYVIADGKPRRQPAARRGGCGGAAAGLAEAEAQRPAHRLRPPPAAAGPAAQPRAADRPGRQRHGGVRRGPAIRPLGRRAVLRAVEGVSPRPDPPAAVGAHLPPRPPVRDRSTDRPRPPNAGRDGRIVRYPRKRGARASPPRLRVGLTNPLR